MPASYVTAGVPAVTRRWSSVLNNSTKCQPLFLTRLSACLFNRLQEASQRTLQTQIRARELVMLISEPKELETGYSRWPRWIM